MDNNLPKRTKEELKVIYQRAISAKNQEESKNIYKEWANYYDEDLLNVKYSFPKLGSSFLEPYIKDKNSKILDIAAGTGMVGEELRKLGYRNVWAMDFSEEMLNIAKHKNCYENFIVGNAHSMENILDNSYDALICIGAFNTGHLKSIAFKEFIRITKTEGSIVFGTNSSYHKKELIKEQEDLILTNQ